MGKAKRLIKEIKKFNEWDIGGPKTQITGGISENFVEEQIKKIYKNSHVEKMSSQTHPDFFVFPKSEFKKIPVSFFKKEKLSKNSIMKWEDSKNNKKKIKPVRVEVKTTKGKSYTLNDTFPEPKQDLSEIYVLFDISNKKLFVTTSAYLAKSFKISPSIEKRHEKSENAKKEFNKNLREIWEDTPITTAARPTYRMKFEYANKDAPEEEIKKIFSKAGFRD